MELSRRKALQAAMALGAALAAGLLKPMAALAAAWNKEAFDAQKVDAALMSLGAVGAEASSEILIEAPQIAENGAVVPIEVNSNIRGTTSIAVLIDNNPFPLAAKFDFMPGALPFVRVNVKMGQTANVRVVAAADGKHFTASKEIKVTIGGCGG